MKLYKKTEIRYNKGLPHHEGWKYEWMPQRATESFFSKSTCLDWVREGRPGGKPANLFMSHLA